MVDTQFSLEIFNILNQFPIQPHIIREFSKLITAMPKLLAGRLIYVQLFFKDTVISIRLPFEQMMQLDTLFVQFCNKEKFVADVFAAGYYDLYDTLGSTGVGKLNDEELLKALLENSDVKAFLRYHGTTLYEEYEKTHTPADVDSLHIRNKL